MEIKDNVATKLGYYFTEIIVKPFSSSIFFILVSEEIVNRIR